MTEQQHHPQPAHRSTAPGVDAEELDRAWAKFSKARASLAEVMSDDELRAFGFNVEALDERP